ncbi:10960_t:CDS:1, partial [Gigaspora margarita]
CVVVIWYFDGLALRWISIIPDGCYDGFYSTGWGLQRMGVASRQDGVITDWHWRDGVMIS